MKPDISFHGIAKIELRAIEVFTADEATNRRPFATRDLVLTDAEGNRFRIGLFADTEEALFVSASRHWTPSPVVMQERAIDTKVPEQAPNCPDCGVAVGETGQRCGDVPPSVDLATGKVYPW